MKLPEQLDLAERLLSAHSALESFIKQHPYKDHKEERVRLERLFLQAKTALDNAVSDKYRLSENARGLQRNDLANVITKLFLP